MLSLQDVSALPVAAEVDVLVVGGGPTGVPAAVGAARLGARTLIVEQFNCLGGIATAGGHAHICLYSAWCSKTRVVGGVPYEMAQRVAAAGYGRTTTESCDYELEGMKLVLEELAADAKVDLLYHTFCGDTVMDGNRVAGIVVQNKSGRQVIRARRTVDATGDGDVAARAGAAFTVGEPGTGNCQPVTLMFTLGGVDWKRVCEFRKGDYKLEHVWLQAQAAGDMRPFQNRIMGWWWTPTRPDQVGVNFTHILHIDGTSAADLTRATIEGRRQAFECVQVFRKYVPGMEQCHIISTPNTVGVRETRRIHGEYTLTRADVVGSRPFADSIGYGSFFIDIHNPTGPGLCAKSWNPPANFRYQMPYRIIVPQGVDDLLVAGRCASCDHEALGSLRVMPQCGVMGHAAGVASVLSLRAGVPPRRVEIPALQAALRAQGAILDEADIARANPASVA